jgi:hypothetical protein
VVCSTLSAAGSAAMIEACADAGGDTPFDVVIVDEAAQGLETSLLIPLRYSAQHCILVGDPQQLPATVFSRLAESKLFSRSLFERLQVCAACSRCGAAGAWWPRSCLSTLDCSCSTPSLPCTPSLRCTVRWPRDDARLKALTTSTVTVTVASASACAARDYICSERGEAIK